MKMLLSIAFVLSASLVQAGQITPSDLASLPKTDVVLLGEIHDNPVHHQNQERALKAIAPRAIVYEMLTGAQALHLTPDMLQDADALEQALDWAHGGWPDFAMYYPLFRAASGKLAIGAQLKREALRQAISGDALTAFGADAARFGLDQPLPEGQQAEREALQFAAHCDALPEQMLPGMVMAQRMRDAALARAIMLAIKQTGGPVAVITGNGHAQTAWGIPVVLAQVAPDLRVLSIGQFEQAPEGDVAHDLWLVTTPTVREDPCAAFN